MSIFRIICHVALALALLVDGLASAGMGMTMNPGQDHNVSTTAAVDTQTDKHGSCHQQAPAATPDQHGTPEPSSGNCCDGGTCTCSCLQHAPAAFVVHVLPDAVPFAMTPQLGQLVSVPSTPIAPQLRPPIA